MFNLESSIANWRKEMLAAGIPSPAPLEELESHLREEVERLKRTGLDPERAFALAVQKLGPAMALKMEYSKVELDHLNRPLAWTAWTVFVISFFLPAYADGYGWQCAGLSAMAVTWPETIHGDWPSVHMATLNLANLVMLASPFLFYRHPGNARLMAGLRWASLSATALTWSFLWLLLTQYKAGNVLKPGSYVWAASFLLLYLATSRWAATKKQNVRS
jgi:hypothetical protein